MKLLRKIDIETMLRNGMASRKAELEGKTVDHKPVVRLFLPGTGATWMLTELVPDQPDLAFGLCDLGVGFPELGYVSIRELNEVRTALGNNVERDRFWEAKHTLSKYTELADETDCISHL